MSYAFECFTGEFINIVLNKDNKNSISVGHDIRTVQDTIVIRAYLIEEDDEFYFLGHDPGLICIAAKKRDVVVIESADPNEEMMHQLNDAVPIPIDDLGVN